MFNLFKLIKKAFIESIEKKKLSGAGIVLYSAWYALFSMIMIAITYSFFILPSLIIIDIIWILILVVLVIICLPITVYPFVLLKDPMIFKLLKDDFKDFKKSSSKNKIYLFISEFFLGLLSFIFTLMYLNNIYLGLNP